MSEQQQLTLHAFDKDPDLLNPTLEFLVSPIPLHELELMVSDADEVEKILEAEIALLDAKLKDVEKDKASVVTDKKYIDKVMTVDEMQQLLETPLDKYGITLSSLLGRLRSPLETMHPPHSTLPHHVAARTTDPVITARKKMNDEISMNSILDLKDQPCYTQTITTHALLTIWKRISGHRSASVFRRPVQDREAPGYSSKILFPVDLSLVRKMIVSNIITSYAELHRYIGILAHNCVKFNGRESDYGLVAREFEGFVDESIVLAVANAAENAIKSGKLALSLDRTKEKNLINTANDEPAEVAQKASEDNNPSIVNDKSSSKSNSSCSTEDPSQIELNLDSSDTLRFGDKDNKGNSANIQDKLTLSKSSDKSIQGSDDEAQEPTNSKTQVTNEIESNEKVGNSNDNSLMKNNESNTNIDVNPLEGDKFENQVKSLKNLKNSNQDKTIEGLSGSKLSSEGSPGTSASGVSPQKRKRSQTEATNEDENASTYSQGPIRRSKRAR